MSQHSRSDDLQRAGVAGMRAATPNSNASQNTGSSATVYDLTDEMNLTQYAKIELSKSAAGTLNLVKEIRAEVIAARKESTAADYIIAQLVGALDLAITHIPDDNADKEAIVTLRNKSVSAHNWSRRQSPNQADRDTVFDMSVEITNDIHGYLAQWQLRDEMKSMKREGPEDNEK